MAKTQKNIGFMKKNYKKVLQQIQLKREGHIHVVPQKIKNHEITISSDNDLFKNNTYSKFNCILDNQLCLECQYELGLSSIIFPCDYLVEFCSFQIVYFPKNIITKEKSDLSITKFQILNNEIKNLKLNFNNTSFNFLNSQLLFESIFVFLKENIVNEILNFEKILDDLLSFLNKEIKLKFDKINNFVEFLIHLKINIERFILENQIIENFIIKIPDRSSLEIVKERINKSLSRFDVEINAGVNVLKLKFKSKFIIKIKFDSLFQNITSQNVFNYTIRFNKSGQLNLVKYFEIFTDIISNDFNNPMLKQFKCEGQFDETTEINFERIQYFSINRTYLKLFYFEIKDQNHNFIDFQSGPIILNLSIVKK